MDQSSEYSSARILALIYTFFAVFSLFINIKVVGALLFLIVFPFLLRELKRSTIEKYGFSSVKVFFNISIIVTILSTMIPYIGGAIISTMVDISTLTGTKLGDKIIFPSNIPHQNLLVNFDRLMVVLLIFRGISFIILSGWLLRKFNGFRASMKVAIISLIFLGIRNVFSGVVMLFPIIFKAISNVSSTNYLIFFAVLSSITYIFLFGSMFFVFRKGNSTKNHEKPIESGE